MAQTPRADIRETLLQVVHEMQPRSPSEGGTMQQGSVFDEVAGRLGVRQDHEAQLAILTLWGDLLRTGYLAWGHNLSNPNPPFFHITDRGRRALARLSRDPGNPAGYLAHVARNATLNSVARSYLDEGLACFSSGLHKAAAVMLGAAAESLILELRDTCVPRLQSASRPLPKGLQDWKIKTVSDAMNALLAASANAMPIDLQTDFRAYWPAFIQQIRTTRNDAGHPLNVDPVDPDVVHASFLAFPEVARTATKLLNWIPGNL